MGTVMVERGSWNCSILVAVLLCVLLPISSLPLGSEGASYTSEPLIVEGNDGFAGAGFSGSGTAEEPYLLSEMNVNAFQKLSGIVVSNTTAHFRIVGCTVHDAYSPDRDPLNMSASGSGILLINVTNAIIDDLTGESNVRGVTVVGSRNVTINGSRFIDNIEAGVHVVNCLDGSVKVTNSTFRVGTMDDGVLLEGSSSVQVTDNVIEGGRNGIAVRAKGLGLGGHLLAGNALSGQSENGVLLGGTSLGAGDLVLNNTVCGAAGTGVNVHFGTSGKVYGNSISGCSCGVRVDWSDNEVIGNVLSNNTNGVVLGSGADRNLIDGNLVQDGTVGVLVSPSQGNLVLNNTIMRMDTVSGAGVHLWTGEVRDARIEGNGVSFCTVGIRASSFSPDISGLRVWNNTVIGSLRNGTYLLNTIGSSLLGNSFLSGGGSGVYLGPGCRDIVLKGNEASFNGGAGLYVRDADECAISENMFISNALEGVYLESGSGNAMHGNALLFNRDSGRQYSELRPQAFCGEGGNNWSSGTGNLWADWLSPDDNDDGIVDLPYELAGGYQDPFPLTSIPGLDIPVDITPPEVIGHSPQGRDAEQGEAISVTFSEDMNASSVIVMVENSTRSGIWDDRTFILDLELEFETDYQVVVTGEDLSGNALEQFGWTFRTEDRNAGVAGRVINENGQPLSGVLVTVGEQEALTNVNGSFIMTLSPGDHALNMSKAGYLDRMVMVHVEPGGDMVLEDSVMETVAEGNGLYTDDVVYAALALLAVTAVAAVALLLKRRR